MAEASRTLAQQDVARRSALRDLQKSLLKSKTGLVGLALVLLVIAGAILAPVIAPHSPTRQSLPNRLTPPVWQERGNSEFLLGTDTLGRDIFSRLIFGSRISLIVGVSAVLIGGVLGTTVGLLSGYYGGKTDAILMRIADIQLAMPSLVLYLTIMAVLGPSVRNLILGLGVTNWVLFGRVSRSQVLSLKHAQYVDAARAIGMRDVRILVLHILPNIVNSVIVLSSIVIAGLILAEAGLSFLGLGIPPPTPTWGRMVADGRDHVELAWWISTLPGLAIFFTVLGFNLFGDWLRDFLDPRLRHD